MTVSEHESLTIPNPRTRDQALHWAYEEIHVQTHYKDLCARFVANAYGWAHSGEETAKALLEVQHGLHAVHFSLPGDLVFWPAGAQYHVALRARHSGHVYSTDVKAEGRVSLVPIDTVTSWLDTKPAGASVPYFPHGIR